MIKFTRMKANWWLWVQIIAFQIPNLPIAHHMWWHHTFQDPQMLHVCDRLITFMWWHYWLIIFEHCNAKPPKFNIHQIFLQFLIHVFAFNNSLLQLSHIHVTVISSVQHVNIFDIGIGTECENGIIVSFYITKLTFPFHVMIFHILKYRVTNWCTSWYYGLYTLQYVPCGYQSNTLTGLSSILGTSFS